MKLILKICLLILILLVLYVAVTQIATLLYQRHYNQISLIRAKQVVAEINNAKKKSTQKLSVSSNQVSCESHQVNTNNVITESSSAKQNNGD